MFIYWYDGIPIPTTVPIMPHVHGRTGDFGIQYQIPIVPLLLASARGALVHDLRFPLNWQAESHVAVARHELV